MNGCRICTEVGVREATERWNRPLFESDNFVVVPSIGALVPGWLLLLPRQHMLCYGQLPEQLDGELTALKSAVLQVLRAEYGETVVFEHGPSQPNCAAGCSVDHAHLHFVPTSTDLEMRASAFLPFASAWNAGNLDACRVAHRADLDYLYIEQPDGRGRIFCAKGIGSQILRRAIAADKGKASEYNWREHPQLPIVLSTIEVLKASETYSPLDATNAVGS